MKKREREYFWFLCSPAITKIEMRKVSILLDVVVETFIQNLEMVSFCKSHVFYFHSFSHLHQDSHISKVVIHLVSSGEITKGYFIIKRIVVKCFSH